VNGWQFVVHQEALHTIDNLRSTERRLIRAALVQLVENPWQLPDGQIRPRNDRIYLVKNVRSLCVIYWLDAFARQVYIVRIDLPK
jgi:hypothetical protein